MIFLPIQFKNVVAGKGEGCFLAKLSKSKKQNDFNLFVSSIYTSIAKPL